MTELEPQPITYTVRETAKLLRMGINQTYEAIHTGEIPSVKIGQRIHVPRVALEKKLAEAGQPKGEAS